jgi:putative glutamine amidotransferase
VGGVRPVIAIPTYRLAVGRVSGWVAGGYALPEGYVAAVRRAGGRPLLVPGGDADAAEETLAGVDGLLLAGGGDLVPARYGGLEHPSQYGLDPERDDTEVALLAAALAIGMPVFAICRGLQLVDVAFGGTLDQHLPDRFGTTHGDPVGGLSATHDIRVSPGSRLADAVGGAERLERVTSHHHQGVAEVGDGLVAVGWSDDGLVEAVEPDGDGPWLVAVQWHPEATAGHEQTQQALFDAFVAEARLGMDERSEVARI